MASRSSRDEAQRIGAALEPFRDRVTAVASGTEHVCKYVRDLYRDAVRELFRFLTLKVVAMDTDATLLSPSVPVDDLWHVLILETKLYRDICHAILPATVPAPRILDHKLFAWNREARYRQTLAMYKDVFGVKAPLKWWPFEGKYPPLPLIAPVLPAVIVRPTIETPRKKFVIIDVEAMNSKSTILRTADPSVDHFKKMVEVWVGIPPDQQQVVFNGTELKDGRTLADYSVHQMSKVRVSWTASALRHTMLLMQCPTINVLDFTGQPFMYAFRPSDSVQDVKSFFEDKEGAPVNLYFLGQQMHDERTLLSYSIRENVTLQLVPGTPPPDC